jgi:hypothetical protein
MLQWISPGKKHNESRIFLHEIIAIRTEPTWKHIGILSGERAARFLCIKIAHTD